MPMRRRLLSAIFAVIAVAALALVPAAGASAHDYLVDSSPKADSTQTTPLKQVSLTFDDIVLDLSGDGSSSLVQVTGPDGSSRHFETGCPKISGRVVTVPVALGRDGKYLVTWQIVSADGHTVSNSIAFTYRAPAGTAAASGSTSRPTCGRAVGGSGTAGAATPAPTASSSSQSSSSSSAALGIVIAIAAVIVGLAIVGVVVIVLTGRRRPRGDGTTPDRRAARPPEDD
jgi:methionine-rich copper-binding protein CopC